LVLVAVRRLKAKGLPFLGAPDFRADMVPLCLRVMFALGFRTVRFLFLKQQRPSS
jgi:hypothetical protein